jgi:hypothetical protein
MKISISIATLNTIADIKARKACILAEVFPQFAGLYTSNKVDAGLDVLTNRAAELANISAVREDREFVIEVNDELIIKYYRIWLKAAPVMLPIFKSLKELSKLLDSEFDELEEMITRKK